MEDSDITPALVEKMLSNITAGDWHINSGMVRYTEETNRLQAIINKWRKALEFYADEKNYDCEDAPTVFNDKYYENDRGKIAREALNDL